MFIYEIAPIDFCWEMLPSVADVAATLARRDVERLSDHDDSGLPSHQSFISSWEMAKRMALESGWDGDIRTGPAVIWLPTEGTFDFGFAFKQDNNGTTYVISPIELPHLEAL